MLDNSALLLVLLLCVAAMYVGAPLLILFQQRLAAHPEFETLDFARLDPDLAGFLMKQTKVLYALGFDEPALIQVSTAVPNVAAYLIMVVNRQRGDKAMVSVVRSTGPVLLQTTYVEFSTRFKSAQVFNTSNASELMAFPPNQGTVRTQVPMVRDPQELYELHTFVMDKHGAGGDKELYEPGQEVEYLTQFAFIKVYEDKAQRGWLYYDEPRDVYRYTLKGAYLATWGLMQPFKKIRQALLQRRAKKVLAEFAQAQGPTPGGERP
jgi:hypothetical protein